MSASAAKWLLASVIVARSSSFLFSKFILVSMNPFELFRAPFPFGLCFPSSCLQETRHAHVFLGHGQERGRPWHHAGTWHAAEMLSLKETDVYLTAFLENMALAIVPLLTMAALRKLPAV